MAIDNSDLFVVYDVSAKLNKSITLGALSSELQGKITYWTRSGTNLYPSNLGDKIGIGTNSPAAKLQVKSAAENESCRLENGRHTFRFKNEKTGTGTDWNAYQQILEHGVDTTTQEFIKFGSGEDSSTTRINLGTQGDPNLMHLVNNKVGIGTDSPIDNLEVKGYATIGMPDDNWQKGNGTYIATKNGYLGHHGSNAVDLVCNGYRTGSGWKSLTADEGGSMIRLQRDGTIRFHGQPEAITGSEPATRMYIKNNGDVGIGNVNPAAKLHINGKARSSSTVDSDHGTTLVTKDYLTSEIDALEDVYVNIDGDTMTGDLTVPSLNGGQLAGFRNQLINGDFLIWQRSNTSAQKDYGADRWFTPSDDVQMNWDSARPFGLTKSIRMRNLNSSTTDVAIRQPIELAEAGLPGPFVPGSTWTMSYYITSNAITPECNLTFQNAVDGVGGSGNAVGRAAMELVETVDGQLGGGAAQTWYRYKRTFTIPNTMVTNSSDLCAIASFVISNASVKDYRIAGCQLEPGPVATVFEHRPIGTELALCQRYYQKVRFGMKTAAAVNKPGSGTRDMFVNVVPTVPVRDISNFSVGSVSIFTNINTEATNNNGITPINRGVSLGLAAKAGVGYQATSAEPTSYGFQGTVTWDNEF